MRKWIFGGLALLLVAVAIAFIWARVRLKPMLRERLITAIREHYRREIEVKDIEISAVTGFGATIHGLVLQQKDREAGLPPMAQVERVRVSATLRGILSEPLQIERVILEGLKINVPPKRPKSADSPEPDKPQTERRYPPRFVINEVLADGTFLQILPKKEGKEPLTFDITKLTLHSAGTTQSMQFRATLTNPKPPGDIQSTGEFGPWDSDEPGLTPVSGSYTFANADLSDFKGLAGILSSEGKYQGMLERIEVDGATDTPNFTLRVSGHPVHLKTQFHAIVDGTNGDTYLQPVNAQFRRSSIVARGGVYGKPGQKGKTISLDVTVSDARVEDMLWLAVKAKQPVMVGGITFRTKFELPPGDRDIIEKLHLTGKFGVESARFTSLKIQDKVEALSQRARPGEEPEDERSVSDLHGGFELHDSIIDFTKLTFKVPGATVYLDGTYGLQKETLDFAGELRTQATVSQMTTGAKSFFLKLADPLFKKKGAGAVIPITITGTREEPKFGLDVGRVLSRKN